MIHHVLGAVNNTISIGIFSMRMLRDSLIKMLDPQFDKMVIHLVNCTQYQTKKLIPPKMYMLLCHAKDCPPKI